MGRTVGALLGVGFSCKYWTCLGTNELAYFDAKVHLPIGPVQKNFFTAVINTVTDCRCQPSLIFVDKRETLITESCKGLRLDRLHTCLQILGWVRSG
jgi:hypothetical protein